MNKTSAVVIHPDPRSPQLLRQPREALEEGCMLARAIDLDIIHREVVAVVKPNAKLFFGKGFVERLAKLVAVKNTLGDDIVVIVNASLTPIQQRNLELEIELKVIDRTQLILEIFGARAQTRAGRLQVELATLNFQRSRLVRSWTHLERQRGGSGFLGGPGERQLELDRRMLMDRIKRVKNEMRIVERTRFLQLNNRRRAECPMVALIGYTNAGKSTLFNRLTEANVFSKNMLFSTLDPTTREIKFKSGKKAVLTDTVGFIGQLPIELVEAFKSTLAELVFADLLIHVHDASSSMIQEEFNDVRQVLENLGISEEDQEKRVIHVLNKTDLIHHDDQKIESLCNMFSGVFVSSLNSFGIEDLMNLVECQFNKSKASMRVYLSPADGAARAWLHRYANIEASEFDCSGWEKLAINVGSIEIGRFAARWPNIYIEEL